MESAYHSGETVAAWLNLGTLVQLFFPNLRIPFLSFDKLHDASHVKGRGGAHGMPRGLGGARGPGSVLL